MRGYIKDYRKELESDIWMMPPLYHRVWQWIKYNVNHRAREVPFRDGTKLLVGPGERLTSLRQIAKGVGYYDRGLWREPNVKTIKDILSWLETHEMIALDSNSQYTHLKVLNWNTYQGEDIDEGNSQETLGKHSLDTNKNDKNEKNDKKYLKTSQKKFDDDSPPMQLSLHLRKEILGQDSSTRVPDDLNSWAKEADRMIRLDKRDPQEAASLMTWAQHDQFWRANILSMSKFRKKYDTLKRQSMAQRQFNGQQPKRIDGETTAQRMLREEMEREQSVIIDIEERGP